MDTPQLDGDPTAHTRGQFGRELKAWLRDAPRVLADEVNAHLAEPPADTVDVGERAVTSAEWVQLLRDQLAIFDEQNTLRVAPAHAIVAHVAGAWRAIFYGQIRATIHLLDAGMQIEAQANGRAALEHAAFMASLSKARHEDVLEQFMTDVRREGQRQASAQLEILRRIDQENGNANRALLDAVDKVVGGKPAKGTIWDGTQKKLFDALPDAANTYSLFRQLSNHIHAGGGSAMPFLAGVIEHGCLQRIPETVRNSEMLAFLVSCAVIVDRAMDGFLEPPRLEQLHGPLIATVGLSLANDDPAPTQPAST